MPYLKWQQLYKSGILYNCWPLFMAMHYSRTLTSGTTIPKTGVNPLQVVQLSKNVQGNFNVTDRQALRKEQLGKILRI